MPDAVAYINDVPVDKTGAELPNEPKQSDANAPSPALPAYKSLEEFKAAQAPAEGA